MTRPGGLPQPDFLRPERTVPPLLWAACATALAVLGASGLDAWAAWQHRAQAQQQAAAAQARLATVAAPAMPTAPPPAPADTAQADAALRQRLAYRWLAVWQAAEAAAVADVAWLSLSHQAGHGLALEGLAGSPAAAQAATSALRASPDWQQVLLTRLDRSDVPGQPGRALGLSAQPAWRDGSGAVRPAAASLAPAAANAARDNTAASHPRRPDTPGTTTPPQP